VTKAPERPTPSKMLSIGPPKQAENAMMGAKEAMESYDGRSDQGSVMYEPVKERPQPLTFATRSAVEFPIAKMVTPMMASERPKTCPKVVRMVTTSSAGCCGKRTLSVPLLQNMKRTNFETHR
jgi:hypothetical protein